MLLEHRDIQAWIKRQYRQRFIVQAEIDAQNALPDKARHWYQPDLLLRSRRGTLRHIIEVENDPMRKALVGACVLADYSVKAMRQRVKPSLIFVVYHNDGKRQMANFREKLVIARKYCRHPSSIKVVTDDQFKRMSLK